ncbi:MAG: rhomboid family intramembrane serine protease [Endozoicomonas sp. (ex Botrylloides leachii)]|nr:rhomboid family intramembrane serine protease [Endozoicomonas sp. (ex Botrylloides leachii)]
MSEPSRDKSYRALELTIAADIKPLSYFISREGIAHKVTEESGKQIIWTKTAEHASQVEQYYRDWQCGLLRLQDPPKQNKPSLKKLTNKIAWREFPITLFFIGVSILVGVISGFGHSLELINALTFTPFQIISDGLGSTMLHFYTLSAVLDHRQYWRFFTPVFLHFSVVHLAFNMLWLFDLGKRIEAKQGGIHLALIVLATGVASNIVQYAWDSNDAIFGGFSGVVFGLIGYCMVREKVDKSCNFCILPTVYGFMLAYLAIGYSGILDGLFGGNLANGAHTGGLLSGALLGALSGVIFREKSI